MAGLTRWDSATAWADAFASADFNALANNGGILSTATEINNAAGRPFMDLSFRMVTSTISPTTGGGLDFYLLPLLDDGTSYPDNENTTTAANLPAALYAVGRMMFRTKATSTQAGMLRGISAPNGTFKLYVVNRTGVVLPSSSVNMTCKYRLYGVNLDG